MSFYQFFAYIIVVISAEISPLAALGEICSLLHESCVFAKMSKTYKSTVVLDHFSSKTGIKPYSSLTALKYCSLQSTLLINSHTTRLRSLL